MDPTESTFDRDDEFAPGGWPFYRRALIAPLCLCVVAALHLVRVHTCDQTPWKGGGFGMFSTIDDPYARSVRIYLIAEDGEYPVAPPPHLAKRISELRAAPSQSQLAELAERLAKSRWRNSEQHWRNIAAQLAHDSAKSLSEKVTAEGGQAHFAQNTVQNEPVPDTFPIGSKQGASSRTIHPVFVAEQAPAVRLPGAATPIEPAPGGRPSASEVKPRAVRVELWRQHFDASARRLQARQQWQHTYRRGATEEST